MTFENSFSVALSARLQQAAVIAVLVIDDADDALPLAESLWDGGVRAIELTLRTPAATDALARIRKHFPQIIAGAGTVLTPTQVNEAADAGAAFAVAPGTNPAVIKAAANIRLPFAPGIATPSDIESALQSGCRLMKYFPAEHLGGMAYLRAIANPYAHLQLQFIPLGGIDQENASDYLRDPLVHSIGGSWIAPRGLIRQRDWKTITQRASEAAKLSIQPPGEAG
ncbi:bifunctional 4-hydroxy-2-oxoglutarate aldolase/2-dehydro-3-deoxy-phosphogluconate aldolase [Stieleria sp. TO1_6]|uniref:bifunctional 4-hydroxy-2-oxoglutarate aldolase/2-dehydro-3-deoxy-phosphogluconate aldolase n=1 Tax=Stieleria tagensis TaxID=2956795 RepID=UPI00209A80B8|nr:bifunctional 4-hydroxy-2-oxoglutarate aldolase/2-dehydro-3-deoxy-phosphogluconate aldolase [Stieleria tagensis]MCO8120576.1 bifunctional 4-hydroxy-2-oxoglutarate aldolase/2-dehydro-3-deoxy-phosphogluconate aldolase [Stieleria tagensis]